MASPVIAARTAVSSLSVWENRTKRASLASDLGVARRSASTQLNSDFYSGLSEAPFNELQNAEHTASFPAGAIIFMEGQPARGVYILRQGRVKLQTANASFSLFYKRFSGYETGKAAL